MRRVIAAVLVCSVVGCSSSTEAPARTLVWEDDFSGPAGQVANTANWKFDVGEDWGNAQLEYDTDRASNASLDGSGNLVITARREPYRGRQYTSARLITLGKQSFKYGRIEGRMKLPRGRGMWPAFWMLGTDFPTVGWPQTGEIDIMEYRGQEPSTVIGTLHGPGYSGGAARSKAKTLTLARLDNDFHVYAVEWSPEKIEHFIDGEKYFTSTPADVKGPWVFEKPFFIILNVAVGGNFVGAPDAITTFPQAMVVDWIRVYEVAK
ncbi:glycoside hydrolase family 16 protein [Gemmatimonas sp.]|uniref:glycoside hydrolase family 16 protein n=1 Tax=Gemmatimonas sp. TaxID=1962908 RepID=UPI00286E2C6E|nr:glycoside hydrolase family 16 protein [Gemmatimonas sp.]